jgi:hypothetical protein
MPRLSKNSLLDYLFLIPFLSTKFFIVGAAPPCATHRRRKTEKKVLGFRLYIFLFILRLLWGAHGGAAPTIKNFFKKHGQKWLYFDSLENAPKVA